MSEELKKRIMVLDGAMGTMIGKSGLEGRGKTFRDLDNVEISGYKVKRDLMSQCYDLLNMIQPEIVSHITRDYLLAGADIIKTNTFNSNSFSLGKYGLQDLASDLNIRGAEIAVGCKDFYERIYGHKAFVAGSVGPGVVSLSSIYPDNIRENNSFPDLYHSMVTSYNDQCFSLMNGGVDVILLETVYDGKNCMAALEGYLKARDKYEKISGKNIPIIISFTLNDNCRLFSGETLDEVVSRISLVNPLAVGINCIHNPDIILSAVETLQKYPYYISVSPNAGLPDSSGVYSKDTNEQLRVISQLMRKRLINIVGGCCGTTPDYIKAVSSLAKGEM